ncbi:MAG TPA: DUF3150 domain-containing protein [Casimicrobiaceae bacterium]|nr:DUF3150 domain-containing protein [Casimicrobiaceae bacterium]
MSTILRDVIVVSLDVRIWSGRKKLRPEDLTATGRLPPKELVSLGSKRLCHPDALQPFLQLKRRAEARCQAVGIRFARAFAIPKTAAKPVLSDLNTLAEQFQQARSAFLATYDAALLSWTAQYPDYERLIATELLPKAVVASRLVFGYEVFAINAVDADGELAALLEQGGAGNPCMGLVGALYQEVACESCAFVRDSLTGREQVTQKFLRPVRAIRNKLSGLAFLDPGIAPLVDSIDEALAAVPKAGRIDGQSLAALRGVVTLLTDPARMREHGGMLRKASRQDLQGASASATEQTLCAPDMQGEKEALLPAPTRAQRVNAFW